MTKRPDHLRLSLGPDKERHKANLIWLAQVTGCGSISNLLKCLSASIETDPEYTEKNFNNILFPPHRTATPKQESKR